MDKQVRESTLLRKSLLGIRISPFTSPPLFKINDWDIFNAGKVNILSAEERNRNLNYQIQRGDTEKILVRLFLSPDKSVILKTKYYFIIEKSNGENTDCENALYLTLSLINRLGIPMCDDHQLDCFGF